MRDERGERRDVVIVRISFIEVQPGLASQPSLTPHNERNIREQSGKVFPSELEMMTSQAGQARPPPPLDSGSPLYSTLPR